MERRRRVISVGNRQNQGKAPSRSGIIPHDAAPGRSSSLFFHNFYRYSAPPELAVWHGILTRRLLDGLASGRAVANPMAGLLSRAEQCAFWKGDASEGRKPERHRFGARRIYSGRVKMRRAPSRIELLFAHFRLISRAAVVMFQNVGEMLLLLGRTVRALPAAWRHRRKVFEQLFEIGNASLLMACILSLFIGGVIALQSGPVLRERGLVSALGGLVGLSLCKELAPVMMAVLIAGRIGSAMAAEIGSMAVYQEIDALRTMNINPTYYLVLPRMIAISLALPVLVIFSILVGWIGGALVAHFSSGIGLSFQPFFSNLESVVDFNDILNGLIKSFVFAVVIGIVSCHQGLQTRGGPRGIGRSVTKAVVNSIVLVLILDYFLTRLLLELDI
jgi:phospholipid/cholesterol/gamma-HCH transport system permease protein